MARLPRSPAEAEERYCKQARRVGDDSGACLITCVLSEDSYIVAGVGDCRCIAGIGWNKRNKKVKIKKNYIHRMKKLYFEILIIF